MGRARTSFFQSVVALIEDLRAQLSLIIFLVVQNKSVDLSNVLPVGECLVILSIAYEACLVPIIVRCSFFSVRLM